MSTDRQPNSRQTHTYTERELTNRRKRRRIQQLKRRRRKLIIKMLVIFLLLLLIICVVIINFRNRRENKTASNLLNNYYEFFVEEHNLTAEITSEAGFSEWFINEYLDGKAKNLLPYVDTTTLTNEIIFEISGESMHVLYDRYHKNISPKKSIYEKAGAKDNTAEITVAGDLCFAEDGYVLDEYDKTEKLEDCISPELLKIMNETDIFYLNHEYCISDRGTPLNGKHYTFRADPKRMDLLKEMGTDLVSLANNHIYDYGEEALIDTTDLLKQAEIPYVGGGINIEDAKRPVYYIINGIKIGFVAASNAEKNRYTPQATEENGGILLAYDTAEYNQVIQEASKKCDYLIAYIHWGTEDSNQLNSEQQKMGAEFLKSGADIVVGGHPHVLQGIEYMDSKPVIYSLGDFWFNAETKYTGLLQIQISQEGLEQLSFVPCLQKDYKTQYLSEADDQEELYQFLENLSVNVSIDENGVITEK